MKNLFWKESETNRSGIYIHFLQSIQKNKKIVSFADYNRIKKDSKTLMDYSSTRWITRFSFSWHDKGFKSLGRRKVTTYRFWIKKTEDHILITVFDPETHFPSIKNVFVLIEIFMFSSSVKEVLYLYHTGLYIDTMLNLQDLAY